MVRFAVSPIKEELAEASALDALHERIAEQTVALIVPQIKEKIAEVFRPLILEVHRAVVGSGTKENIGRPIEEEMLEAVWAREEEDEFLDR